MPRAPSILALDQIPALQQRRRWVIFGNSVAGKSTLANALAQRLGSPIVRLDALRYEPGWHPVDDITFVARATESLSGDAWICDGAFGPAAQIAFRRSDVVVFLDISSWRCAARVVRRCVRFRGVQRPDAPHGCLDQLTTKMVWGTLAYPRARLLHTLSLVPQTTPIVRIAASADIARLVDMMTLPALTSAN